MSGNVCQSCGMTMKSSKDYGTNGDTSPVDVYCCHCYQDGNFTHDVTMEEMVDANLQFLDQWNRETGSNYTVEQARPMLRDFLASLSRWKKDT